MARARGRARARTSLELGVGLIRVSCIIKEWFKQLWLVTRVRARASARI